MKAFALVSADQPASLTEVPRPEVGEHDVLVAVKAASVNGIDVFQANGYLAAMMPHTYPTVVGRDFAGVVEAIGSAVHDHVVGDEVLGFIPASPPLHSGSFAEYVAGGPELVLARKPGSLGFADVAALPLAGVAALDLLDALGAGKGDILLVVGATGGVGSFLVQLATQRGLIVVATARPEEQEFAMDLGAVQTIDYTAGSMADAVRRLYPEGILAVVDVVNQKDGLTELSSVVRSGGHVATLMNAADVEALATRGITGHNVMATPTAEKLRALADLAASRSIRVHIHGDYPLDRAGEAIAAFQQGTRGKLVVSV